MGTTDIRILQSLYTPYGIIDLTISDDALIELGRDVRSHTGMKSTAVLLWDETVSPADLMEAERSLTSVGFTLERISPEHISLNTRMHSEPDARESSLAPFAHLVAFLAEKNITASDALVAVGGRELLNHVLAVASSYARKLPGPITCVLIPTTYDALLLASAYPASLPLVNSREINSTLQSAAFYQGPALSFVGSPSFVATTPALLQAASARENLLLAQALMVKGAFIDSPNTWQAFLKDIDELAFISKELHENGFAATPNAQTRDSLTFLQALIQTAKSLALVEYAQTVQTRASSGYGNLFAAALSALDPNIAPAHALAEGLRLSADLGVVLYGMPLNYAIEQSAALEILGLPETKLAALNEAYASDAFVVKVKQLARQTSRTLQVVVPMAPGKLALTHLSNDVLESVYQKRYGGS